jgi:hypothetical protein
MIVKFNIRECGVEMTNNVAIDIDLFMVDSEGRRKE